MSELSPAARAVWSAFLDHYEYEVSTEELFTVAAVLRAVAKEIGAPGALLPNYVFSAPAEQWHYEFKLQAQRQILAIANELEHANDRINDRLQNDYRRSTGTQD